VDVQGPKKAVRFSQQFVTGHQATDPGTPGRTELKLRKRRDKQALVRNCAFRFELTRREAIERLWSAAQNDSDWFAAKGSGAQDRLSPKIGACLRWVRPPPEFRASVKAPANPVLTLPSSVKGYPGVVAQAVSQLRLGRLSMGPLCTPIGYRAVYLPLAEATDDGYPVPCNISSVLWTEKIIWAPANRGRASMLTTRGGDFFELTNRPGHLYRLSEPFRDDCPALYFQETINLFCC